MESSPLGYFSGAFWTLKFGGGGRSTLIGGMAVPCPCTDRAANGTSNANASGTIRRRFTDLDRFMEDSSRAMRSPTNNTRVFGGQAWRQGRRRLTAALAALLLVSWAAAGCRGARKAPPDGAGHAGKPSDPT